MTANYQPIVELLIGLLAQVNAGTLTLAAAARRMPDGLGIELLDDGQAAIVMVAKGVRG